MPRLKILNDKVAIDLHFDHAIAIGRHIANSLPLPDTEVSRRHAQIFPREEHYVISDLGSRNGVYVNGEAVQEAVLKVGDEIAVGMTLMFFDPPEGAALSDLLSPRGAALWKKLPRYEKYVPTQTTTYSTVELNGLVEEWLDRRKAQPPISFNLHGKFLSFALALDAWQSRKELCNGAIEFLRERIGGERLAVMALSGEKKELEVQALQGCEEGELVIPKDILRIALDAEKGVFCSDTASDFRFQKLAKQAGNEIGSFVAAPIFCADEYYGFIYVDQQSNGKPFDFKSLVQAHLAASILGNALHWFKIGRKRKQAGE